MCVNCLLGVIGRKRVSDEGMEKLGPKGRFVLSSAEESCMHRESSDMER